jgi:hypothetical protein
MGRAIKQFPDGAALEFDAGNFDDWCVYLVAGGGRAALRDSEYFARLKELAKRHGARKIYDDFVKIYNATTSSLSPHVLNGITKLASSYGEDSLEMDKLFTILYAGMVAEENKANAILRKRVKRLGMHQVLVDDFEPEVAANFSRGKPWRELDVECNRRGF